MAVDEEQHEDVRHPEGSPGDAMMAASQGGKLSDAGQNAALEWFLSADPADLGSSGDGTYTFEVNVALAPEKRFIPWTIRVVDSDRIRELRRAGENRNARRQRQMGVIPDADDSNFELRLIVEGTVNPDLYEVARNPQVVAQLRGMGLPERHPDPMFMPMQAVKARFGHKPLLIEQIAREILNFGGGDAEDVRDQREAAAGKS